MKILCSIEYYTDKESLEELQIIIVKQLKEEPEALQEQKIPVATLKKILSSLKIFEEKRLFLHQNITLGSVAKKLKTNTSYLSKVINSYKGKNFRTYLNELRIYHAVEELKHNKELQKYTIDGIAKDMGFNNAESFTTAFKKVTGLYPSFFIKKE